MLPGAEDTDLWIRRRARGFACIPSVGRGTCAPAAEPQLPTDAGAGDDAQEPPSAAPDKQGGYWRCMPGLCDYAKWAYRDGERSARCRSRARLRSPHYTAGG
jgi:hypothetical protein